MKRKFLDLGLSDCILYKPNAMHMRAFLPWQGMFALERAFSVLLAETQAQN